MSKLERIWHRGKEKLSLNEEEFRRFTAALIDFAKTPVSLHNVDVSAELTMLPQTLDAGEHKIHTTPLTYLRDPKTKVATTDNEFFNFLARTSLYKKEQHRLSQYLKNGKIVMFRVEKPPKQFMRDVKTHSAEHHHRLAPLTEAITVLSAIRNRTKKGTASEQFSVADEEQHALEQLQELSGETIRFVPLSSDSSGEVPNDIKSLVLKLNNAAKPYGFIYNVLATTADSQKMQSILAGALVLVGSATSLAFGPMTQGLGKIIDEQKGQIATDTISQVYGEGLTVLLALIDRLYSETQHGVIFNKDTHSLTKQVVDYLRGHRESIKERAKVLGYATVAALALSISTDISGNYLPLLLTAPANTSFITWRELKRREDHAKNISHTSLTRETVRQYSLEQIPPVLRPLFKNNSDLALAAADFFDNNKTAAWSLYGTYVSLGTLLAITSKYPDFPKALVLAGSGVVIEQFMAIIGGVKGMRKNPWDKFQDLLPLYEKLLRNDTDFMSSHQR